MKDSPLARVIGVHGNRLVKVEYGPSTYIEASNEFLSTIPSLYDYQMKLRLA
jgi:hypothetical protein